MPHQNLPDATRASLERYAERGTRRGPDAVLDAATGTDSPYVGPEPGPRQRNRWVAPSLAVAAIAVLVIVVFAAQFGGDGDNADSAASPNTSTSVSQEVLDEATERLMEQRSAGWIPVAPDAGVPGIEMPSVVWVRAGDGVAPPEYDPVNYRVPVYDEMDGLVIGYDYQKLGFVPLDIADSGHFDAAQARIDKHGCDLLADVGCRQRLAEERSREGG